MLAALALDNDDDVIIMISLCKTRGLSVYLRRLVSEVNLIVTFQLIDLTHPTLLRSIGTRTSYLYNNYIVQLVSSGEVSGLIRTLNN